MWNSNVFNKMDTTGTGFFANSNLTNSPSTTQNKAPRRHQSVMPLVVRQIRNHPDDDFKLFGISPQIVRLVGILKEYEVQSTKATYQIQDHTGIISAIWWLESDSNTVTSLPLVNEGSYVKVFGSLRSQEGQKVIMMLKMFPVDDINEITTHLLEVIHTRLEAEALQKNQGATRIKPNNPGIELANSMTFMNSDINSLKNGLTTLQQKLCDILRATATSAVGASRQEVIKHFPLTQHREVLSSLEFLVSEGYAFTTLDDNHFKVTDTHM